MAVDRMVRIKRQMMIHAVVQSVLLLLLIAVAWHFQRVFAGKGEPQVFLNSLISTLILQGVLFYPIYRFAAGEARNEVAALSTSVTQEIASLRKKRISGDFLKAAVFIFYATFIALSPPVTFVLSTSFFSFIATAVTYLQSFNYSAKKFWPCK